MGSSRQGTGHQGLQPCCQRRSSLQRFRLPARRPGLPPPAFVRFEAGSSPASDAKWQQPATVGSGRVGPSSFQGRGRPKLTLKNSPDIRPPNAAPGRRRQLSRPAADLSAVRLLLRASQEIIQLGRSLSWSQGRRKACPGAWRTSSEMANSNRTGPGAGGGGSTGVQGTSAQPSISGEARLNPAHRGA